MDGVFFQYMDLMRFGLRMSTWTIFGELLTHRIWALGTFLQYTTIGAPTMDANATLFVEKYQLRYTRSSKCEMKM